MQITEALKAQVEFDQLVSKFNQLEYDEKTIAGPIKVIDGKILANAHPLSNDQRRLIQEELKRLEKPANILVNDVHALLNLCKSTNQEEIKKETERIILFCQERVQHYKFGFVDVRLFYQDRKTQVEQLNSLRKNEKQLKHQYSGLFKIDLQKRIERALTLKGNLDRFDESFSAPRLRYRETIDLRKEIQDREVVICKYIATLEKLIANR